MCGSTWLLLSLTVFGGEHLDPGERTRITAALERGSAWLLARQDERGAFAPAVRTEACDVAMTAIALWALERSATSPADAGRAAKFLLEHRQPDGGIYDPDRGLPVYTSGIAAQALRSLPPTERSQITSALREVELYVYRRDIPESLVDAEQEPGRRPARAAEEAARILAEKPDVKAEQRRALEFLSRDHSVPGTPIRTRDPRWARSGPGLGQFSYEDVLPFVYKPLEPDHQIALRAHEALRAGYDLERNPDLTRRYGEAGFPSGTQGLYYYYLLVARALSVRGSPWLETSDGARHDWVRELSDKLMSLQKPDGSWVNADKTWWEDEPVLVTSYALLTLALCRDVPGSPAPR